MVKIKNDVTDLRESVDRLREHVANRTCTNQGRGKSFIEFPSGQGVYMFILATIGAITSLAVLGAFLYPLGLASFKFWAGS